MIDYQLTNITDDQEIHSSSRNWYKYGFWGIFGILLIIVILFGLRLYGQTHNYSPPNQIGFLTQAPKQLYLKMCNSDTDCTLMEKRVCETLSCETCDLIDLSSDQIDAYNSNNCVQGSRTCDKCAGVRTNTQDVVAKCINNQCQKVVRGN